ncbi:hypothetical protein PQH01_17460 [Bacteroides cellulosilyticus]|uniref:hypothetical protein n=1 Tax=Bacteroides TaxID=816 RepID=UPI00234DE5AA|nr:MULTISPECIES: hypothetical protein [Bacteroides]MDC7177836.1 hypothetical protein [Bacteroides cellulosilyticus]MDC7182657.1 hypothetical protein [Bacteroides cellulosilyticus]
MQHKRFTKEGGLVRVRPLHSRCPHTNYSPDESRIMACAAWIWGSFFIFVAVATVKMPATLNSY